MEKMQCQLTVFWEAPFWVGLYERLEGKELTVCKIVFGAEPKDYEVYAYLLQHWNTLCFGPPVAAQEGVHARAMNPKRQQREIKKQLSQVGGSKKAQQAISLAYETNKLARRNARKKRSEEEKCAKFALQQQKKKEKHRGR